jgi:predicted permease
VALTLIAGLVASLFPVWRSFRTDPQRAINEGQARTSESRGSATVMRALVGFQVALSLVLLVGAITFARTLANLRAVDTGFRDEDVLTMSIELPKGYEQPHESIGVWSRVLAAMRETPGVRAAGLCSFTPLSGRDSGAQIQFRGYQPASAEDSLVRVNHVSEGYFETLGIRLLRGRLLTDRDAEGTLKVALINESAARKYFANRDPIGQSLEFERRGTADSVYQIVGVVADTKHLNLREPSLRMVFIPIRQPRDAYRRVTLTVASTAPDRQMALLGAIRSRVAAIDSGLFISEIITMRRQLDSTLVTERLLSGLSSAFGVLALILATVGLYGVLSYRIGQQRRSIGVRIALGASPSSVTFGVLRQSGLVVGAGVLAGLPFAYLGARTADSMLWGVKSSDPPVYIVAALVLCLAGFVSAYVPARRASAIDPAAVLRSD